MENEMVSSLNRVKKKLIKALCLIAFQGMPSFTMEVPEDVGGMPFIQQKIQISDEPIEPIIDQKESQLTFQNAPMPGKVIRVCVSVGQWVEKGDEICIILAMKMENTICSSRPGKIDHIFVEVEDMVEEKIPVIKFLPFSSTGGDIPPDKGIPLEKDLNFPSEIAGTQHAYMPPLWMSVFPEEPHFLQATPIRQDEEVKSDLSSIVSAKSKISPFTLPFQQVDIKQNILNVFFEDKTIPYMHISSEASLHSPAISQTESPLMEKLPTSQRWSPEFGQYVKL